MADRNHADSAGVPWGGREFARNSSADDDGSAPPAVLAALTAFRAGTVGESAVVDALRGARVLVPLIAEAGDEGYTDSGLRVDKTQELSLVTVVGPDGRAVQPAFTSVASMATWNPTARPIPVTFASVALAAASEGTDLVILDPTVSTEFVIRRPALWSVAQSLPWAPSYLDTAVLEAFMDAAEPEPAVRAVQLAPGDPTARLDGAELLVHLTLAAGLDRAGLDGVLGRLRDRWAASEVIAARVDSLAVQVARAD
jgi:hypothetical protein